MMTTYLVHTSYGKPEEVVTLYENYLPELTPQSILVDLKYASINPADINMIEGNYIEQPPLPVVLGTEAVGVVREVGSEVTHYKANDVVFFPFRKNNLWRGVWATSIILDQHDAMKLPKNIDLKQAAMLAVNPLTAWFMLNEFVTLEKGDFIIQNLANSAVGQCVVQVAKYLGLKTINIVRNDNWHSFLKDIGATYVYNFEPSLSKKIKEFIQGYSIKLGFNGVGGESAYEVAKVLSEKGVLVTYGAMSKEPLTVSNGQLIYKDLSFCGFNRTRFIKEEKKEKIKKAYETLIPLVSEGKLVQKVDRVFSLSQYEEALMYAQKPGRKGKILFKLYD